MSLQTETVILEYTPNKLFLTLYKNFYVSCEKIIFLYSLYNILMGLS